MNFLVLVNGAPKYKYFYAEIAKKIEEKGHSVYFAVNAQKSTIVEPLDYIDDSQNTFFFDRYLKKNFDSLKDQPIAMNETWGDVLFSDFDRFFCHNYNLSNDKVYWSAVLNGLESFFTSIITDHSIDVVLYENVSNSFAYMAYTVGDVLDCTYIGLIGSRLPNRYEIQTSIHSESDAIVSNIENVKLTEDEEKWYKDYKEKFFDTQPDYMKNNIIAKKISLSNLISYRKILTAQKIFQVSLKTNAYYNYQSARPIENLMAMYKLNWRKMLNETQSNKYYLPMDEVDELIETNKENFYVYPTHYHPEASTSVLAPDYTNELNNIISIHNNLPVGSYLYVKDHISARGIQNKDFYKKISALPGVRLIHFDYNVKKLVSHSHGVITVTSTVGYEAVLMNKPVYLLGRVFYENFPNVIRLNSFSELRSTINQKRKSYSDEEISKFIIAYHRYTFEGQLLIGKPDLWKQEYFSDIADNILYKIKDVRKTKV
ncbi:capsular biosynthesis protein [Psychrobacter sp. APC 3281]|uniref:capsular polysaccharide export protein, LipB/KpsS family n=1 Tax=Psychrobacter sp. APC 3281 TaxID=3035190 RepID=UPI0025B5EB05|nr:capsular biosynthesis protein [Psychrobacter sp. APC 3281]MDN3448460.1 capsular biosynthesis protein [Psychrobacter sp. APC 3281]